MSDEQPEGQPTVSEYEQVTEVPEDELDTEIPEAPDGVFATPEGVPEGSDPDVLPEDGA